MTKTAGSNSNKVNPSSPKEPRAGGGEPGATSSPEKETGGPKGAEPTRFGDWEQKGRCSDF
ncbi:MAG: DUF1674 domain-containing protein [Rhodospirillaceae bacterium]|jgi:hypothetical protein|nr:DUF1674 domain-containing protein [Rhodospirillaceae bacterium]